MKRELVIVLLVALAFFACTPSAKVVEPAETPSPELAAIDSLVWQQPDSALTCLVSYFGACNDTLHNDSTAYNRHYSQLLLAEALYKNDYAQTNCDELLQAVAYFDALAGTGDADTRDADTRGVSLQAEPSRDARRASAHDATAFLAARAHYINGVGHYENDSVVLACKEYMKALETMESHFDENDLVGQKARFMALTYTRLTELFSDLYLHEQAIYFGKASLYYYHKYDAPPRHIAWMMDEIGSHYDMMKNYDSAVSYYHKGMMILSNKNNLTYRDIATRFAFLSYKKGELFQTTLDQFYKLIAQAESKKEALSRHAILGEIYYHECQYDSAWYHLKLVFDESQSVESKKQVAERLAEICKLQNREDDIVGYANFLIPYATQHENSGTLKSKLAELYNHYKQKELERLHIIKVKKQTRKSVAIIIILLVVTSSLIVLYRKNRKKKLHLETQIKEEQYAHEMKQKALSGRLKISNKALHDTLKRLKEHETKLNNINNKVKEFNKEQYETFIKEPICLELLETIDNLHSDSRKAIKTNVDVSEYMDFAMSPSQIVTFTRTVETAFPNLHELLKTRYPALDRKEWLYCCLYLLRLDKMSICILLQEPYHTCRRYTMKLEKMFGCKNGLSAFLIEQAIVLNH